MKNIYKNVVGSSLLFVAMIAACFGMFAAASPSTVEAAPFSCNIGFYQVMSGQLKILDPETGIYNNLGPVSNATNAMGYNPQDNHIYAIGTVSGNPHLFRYEHDGTAIDLGQPAGLPVTSYVAGDFDENGNLWVRPFAAGTTLWSIDVTAMTASSLTTSFVTFVSEIVYIDGFLYGMNGPALTRINTSTGAVTTASVPELVGTVPALTAMGAGWTTIEDDLYFTWNGNGVIYRIDDYTVGGSPSATPVLQGQMPIGSNDGASCPDASSPVPGVGAVDDAYELDGEQELTVTTSAGTLINDTGDSVEVSDYTQPAHGSVVMNPDGHSPIRPTMDSRALIRLPIRSPTFLISRARQRLQLLWMKKNQHHRQQLVVMMILMLNSSPIPASVLCQYWRAA